MGKQAFIHLDLSASKDNLDVFIQSYLDYFRQSFDFDNKAQELDCYYKA